MWPSRYIPTRANRHHEWIQLANRLKFFQLNETHPARRLSMASALGTGMLATLLASRHALSRVWTRAVLIAGLLLPSSGLPAAAQGYEAMQPMATRADLTAMADRLSRGSAEDRTKASELRTRLRDGDFQPGDRIRLVLDGAVTQDDTIPVSAGSRIRLKDVGEISVAGILRSELQAHMTKELSKYIKDVRVQATPLVRLSVLGPVDTPGFFYMPSDIPITEAIMRAGGPSGNADLKKTVVRRNSKELYDSRNTRRALNEGLTLDQLSLRDGDSIEVGEKSGSNWQRIASIVGVATSIIWALSYGLSR